MKLSLLDIVIFLAYFLGVVGFAVLVAARSRTKSANDFFLASKKLPWYVIGASFIAANISTEHFIGMVGWTFLYGMAVANWEWANVFSFTMLIWVFLPFYMRGNVATMPEFLERRYNKWCRYIYAVVMVVGLVIAMLGGVLFAGAKAVRVFFPDVSMVTAILVLAAAAGAYTIYGGLLSAAWADLLQYILLMVGGLIVTIYGLYFAGGLDELIREMPEKFIVFYPSTHEMIPWPGLVLGIFSVGLWYSCANQFIVQRCLGARSEWDARMGVVMAGFSKAILPFIVVVPGIIAFYLFQDRISDGDQAWPFMVRRFLPSGLIGLVLAGLASAILSTLSAITNSSATIFTLDLYKSILRPAAGDAELHRVGRWSSLAVMLFGVVMALIFAASEDLTVFGVIQTVFWYIAPPIAAVFLVGIFWRRASPAAATVTLLTGYCVYLPVMVKVIFPKVEALKSYNNFTYHTFSVFALSTITLIAVSFFTRPNTREALEGVIWTRAALGVREDEKHRHRGFKSLGLWWGIMAAVIIALYVWTNTRGSHTEWLNAESLAFKASSGAEVRIQERKELESFNLWIGAAQVLFTPKAAGDALTFPITVGETGRYRIDVVVTRGPEYGAFAAEVNNQPAVIRYPVTEQTGKRQFKTRHEEAPLFEANLHPEAASESSAESIRGAHVVQRIGLGEFSLPAGENRVSFIARETGPGGSLIGVDQLMVTRLAD